ncbi:hypothetical protein PTKIN_Ptkin07bG0310500 [Pterospermum kingtungense]
MAYYKPFIAKGLFPPAATTYSTLQEYQVCPESNNVEVSLELSLSSFDYAGSNATATHKGKQVMISTYDKENSQVGDVGSLELSLSSYASTATGKQVISAYDKENSQVGESEYNNDHYQTKEHTEKHRGCLALQLMDVSERYQVGECGLVPYQSELQHNVINFPRARTGGVSLQLSLAFGDTRVSKKSKRMENPIPSSSRKASSARNKRNKVERSEAVVVSELRPAAGHDPWCIKKKLFESDLGNMTRLLLPFQMVESHVLPYWTADQRSKIKEGLPVFVWDCDTNTEHHMVFKQWGSGANVLINNWMKDFVKRRELKLGDEVGLYWDTCSSRFNFSVLSRAAIRH